MRQRKLTNPNCKLAFNLRNRLRKALKRNQKVGSAVKDLGCSIPELKQWFEQQFYDRSTGEKMSWDNWSLHGWHIDHIIPLSSFDLTDRKQLKKAIHWFNLQPLWCEDNWEKATNTTGNINKGE